MASRNDSGTDPAGLICLGVICAAGGVLLNVTWLIEWFQSGFVLRDPFGAQISTIEANVSLIGGVVAIVAGIRQSRRRRR
jgi:hypothetical protein